MANYVPVTVNVFVALVLVNLRGQATVATAKRTQKSVEIRTRRTSFAVGTENVRVTSVNVPETDTRVNFAKCVKLARINVHNCVLVSNV